MPGVTILTNTSPGPSVSATAPTATFFAAGQTERGSVTAPTLIHSLAEYASLLGKRVAYGSLYDAAACYFGEGGTQMYVARVVGPAATTGFLVLNDRAGTPQPTLRFTASSPGAWSTQLTIQVANDVVTNTFVITVFLNGVQVEQHNNLATPAAAVTAFANSPFVVVTNLASVTVAPNNNPAVIAASPPGPGADDAASVTASMLQAALSQFSIGFGSGMVAIPGQQASVVGASLIQHCLVNSRVCCLAPAASTSTAAAKTEAAGFRSTNGAEFAMYAWPWVIVPDGAGGTRTVPPEGFVAGVRARTIAQVGPWQEPIGQFGISQFLVGAEQALDQATNNDLYASNVSGIRTILSTLRLYGYRSLSSDTTNYLLLRDRDILNFVAVQCDAALEQLVGATVDGKGQFFERGRNLCANIVEPLAQAGGLFPGLNPDGSTADPGYVIDTGLDVNPTTQLRQDIVGIAVAIRPSPQADTINVSVTKVAVGTQI